MKEEKMIPGLTIRPISARSLAVNTAFAAIALLCIYDAFNQALSKHITWLFLALDLILGLYFLYLVVVQVLGYMRIDENGLTAMHSWIKGTAKKDLNKNIFPTKRSIAFSDIAKIEIQPAPWADGTVTVMVIKLKNQTQQVLKIGAYRKEDIDKVMAALKASGVGVSAGDSDE